MVMNDRVWDERIGELRTWLEKTQEEVAAMKELAEAERRIRERKQSLLATLIARRQEAEEAEEALDDDTCESEKQEEAQDADQGDEEDCNGHNDDEENPDATN